MPQRKLRNKEALHTKKFYLLFFAHLFFGLSFWPYVLLPVFLQGFGANLLIVGLIMGAAPLSGILVRPWVGTALDRLGRKKCLIAGGLLFLTANFSYLIIDQVNWVIYFVRFLHGLGMGLLMATFFTLAADLSPESRRAEGIGLFGISGHLSGAIGVTMGEEIIRLGGYSSLFLACGILSLISILLSSMVPEPDYHRPVGPVPFFKLRAWKALRLPLSGTVAFALSLSSYMIFLKPYALSEGIGSIRYFFVAYTLSAVGIRLIGGSWPDRFGLKQVVQPAMFSMVLGILFLAIMPTGVGLVISGLLCGLGHGFMFPILSVMIVGKEGKANRGSLMALFTMFFDIGLFIGAPLLGFIAKGGHFAPMYAVAALIQVASLASFMFSRKDQNKRRQQPIGA